MTPTATQAQRRMRHLAWLVPIAPFIVLALACSGQDESLDPAYLSAPGPSGAQTIAPCESGATRDCYITLGIHETEGGGRILTCFEGTQTCVAGVWGECTDGTVTQVPAPETASVSGPGGTDVQALSTPTGCADNPCDPFCRTYLETPPLPLEADTDPNSWFFTWPTGSTADLPGGLYDKGFIEPCTGGWDCQYNSHCFAPTDGDCVHGVCVTGAALAPDCDAGNHNNGSCVTAVCDVDPTCCGAPVVLPECGPGQILGPSGDQCYFYEATAVTWAQARAACQAQGVGWDLVDIQSGPENLFVTSLLTGRTWLGANDIASEGTFVWLDGHALGYANWNGGEPNDAGGNEDCAEMYTSGLWNDMPCNTTRGYVCKGPSRTGATCAHDPCQRGAALKSSCSSCAAQICAARPSCCNPSGGSWDATCVAMVSSTCGNTCSCPNGQAEYGGSCYYVNTKGATWANARAACRANGAGWDLASIGSSGENSFVDNTLLVADSWIGFQDQATEGTWIWSNGDPAGSWRSGVPGSVYANWNWGEPNNSGGEDCAEMYTNGRWNDQSCTSTLNSVCEGPGGTMVLGAGSLPAAGTWDQDCVNLVQDACAADCDPSNPWNVSGQCLPWYAGEVDPDCAGVDLSVDVPCEDSGVPMIPVCNHGNAEAPAGLRLVHFPANSQQYPLCEPDQSHPGMEECWTDEPIPPGYCIAFSDCPSVTQGNNREIMINPPGADYIEECSCEGNWSLWNSQDCGPPICDGGTANATPIRLPVDIVFIIDNSGSMQGEILQVQQRIYEDFAAIIGASGLDYRVIMISRYGSVYHSVGDSNYPICIGPPLGIDCTDPANTPLQNNPPRFFHYSADIESLDAWCKLLEGFGTSDELDGEGRSWTPVAPSGWGQWLRPEAFKTFVVITDDRVNCSDYGYSFNDGNTEASGQSAAASFDSTLLALSPDDFGTAAERKYIWHSIVGLSYNNPTDAAWPPTSAIQTGKCHATDAVAPGTGYQAVSVLTGGLRYPICNNDNFDVIFNAIADNVIETSGFTCEFQINTTVPINPSDTVVRWIHGDGVTTTELVRVRDADSCTADGWYFDTPTDPSTLTLCPDACETIRDDRGSQVIMEIGCAEPAQPTSFYEIYESSCASDGAPQWGYLAWDAVIPDDGSEVQFSVRTALTEAELASAGWVHVATAMNANQVCTMATCAADVFDALDTPQNRYPFLELEITILPGLTAMSPLVDSWELTFSCPPDV